MSTCCGCWGGSQIQEGDASPRSIAETLATAAASGLLPQQQENLDQYRNKIPAPADSVKYQATTEPINHSPNPNPTSVPTAHKETVGTTGSEVFVVAAGIGSSVSRLVDLPPLDLEPHSSPRSGHESHPHGQSTYRAHCRDHRVIEETSEPVSDSIRISTLTSSEECITVPVTTSASSGFHSEAPPLEPSPPQTTVDNLTSKLAIPCTCYQGRAIAREQEAGSKMSRGGRPVPGMGSARGQEPLIDDDDNDNVVGLRAARYGMATFGTHQRRGDERRSPERSRSPVQNPIFQADNIDDVDDIRAYVSADPAAHERRYPTQQPLPVRPQPPAAAALGCPWPMTSAPRRVPVQPQLPQPATRGRGRGKARGGGRREAEVGRRDAKALGDDHWQLERRRREVRQKVMTESRPRGPPLPGPAPGDGSQPEQGDLLIRHRKWPGEPMIEFYDAQRHVVREHDQLLRQNLQYDCLSDVMLCKASVRRATLVGNRQEIRWDDAGSSEITFNALVNSRGPRNRYPFGRRFEPRIEPSR